MMQIKPWLENQKANMYFFLRSHLTLFLFVAILLILGVVFGTLIVGQLDETQGDDLKAYLQGFFGLMGTKSVANPLDIFQASLWNHLKMVGLIWILGISVIGAPVVICFLFLKGAMLGFSVGILVSEFGLDGLLMSIGTIFPQNLFIIPFWIIMVTLSLSFSIEMIKHIVKYNKISVLTKILRYNLCFIIIGLGFVVPTLYEAFISPLVITLIGEKILL